ncbi:MAG TPA: hypothetical protein VGT41_03100 [Candidatus Babeliales bacterium]|nr:hypothetical protein [Candidatus Babeliales bacterium]
MKKNLLISIIAALLTVTTPSNIQTVVPPKAKKLQQLDSTFLLFFTSGVGGLDLYIPKDELENAHYDIEKLLKTHHIPLSSAGKTLASQQGFWPKQSDRYKKRMASKIPQDRKYEININDVPQLLAGARSTIKSFLLTDDKELPSIEQSSIKKGGIRRLFTYAQLERIIKEKKLSHIRLPRKVVVIRDNKTKQYVPAELAPSIIDTAINAVSVVGYNIGIQKTSWDYDLIIFAHKEKRYNRPLSKQAYDDLVQLISEAPFDVGYDNIFADQNGDAVIIDTEFKGEPADTSIEKLGRYKIDFGEKAPRSKL